MKTLEHLSGTKHWSATAINLSSDLLQINFETVYLSMASTFNFLISIGGIYLCFLSWGVLQESLTTKSYDGVRFKFFTFLNLIQAIFAGLIGMLYTKANKLPILFYKDFFLVALSASLASPIGYISLQYINYPVIILLI